MKKKSIPMTIRFKPERFKQAQQLADAEDTSINVIVSQAVRLYFEYKEAEKVFRAGKLDEYVRTIVGNSVSYVLKGE